VAFVWTTYSLFKETYRKYQIQKEVETLKFQAESLDRENQKLKGMISYFGTQSFSEKEAREKLNVKKEGEQVVILKEGGGGKSPDNVLQEKENNAGEENNNAASPKTNSFLKEAPNVIKWWDYFFGEGGAVIR
jgi:hypothetical protein